MKKFLWIVFVLLWAVTANAELRMWTADDGSRFWGEYVKMLLGRIQVRDVNDELRLISIDKLSADDLSYMEKTIPPDVSIDFDKKSDILRELENSVDISNREAYEFTVTLHKKSRLNSTAQLTAELYIIGEDLSEWCDDFVLVHQEVSKFVFPKERVSKYEFTTDEVIFPEYDADWIDNSAPVSSTLRGVKYVGYIVAVLGPKGELLASDTDLHQKWLEELGMEESINRLRQLYIQGRGSYFSRYFNEEIKKAPVPQIPWHIRLDAAPGGW